MAAYDGEETKEERESGIQEASKVLLNAAGYDAASMRSPPALSRSIPWQPRLSMILLVLVLTLPIMIGALVILIGFFGIIARLFSL